MHTRIHTRDLCPLQMGDKAQIRKASPKKEEENPYE